MNGVPLKQAIRDRLWRVADRHPCVRSVTLTGSFVEAQSLDGVSDIDCVVVADPLNAATFDLLTREFDAGVRDYLAGEGYEFRLNPTLGPLKFNGPKLAVLHLMLYSPAARVNHGLQSPFTVLDWQRSGEFRKARLADVFPVFGLQPRHFVGGRRGLRDYLADLHSGVVSYRELVCDEVGYGERKLGKPMTERDRHEFAYHVMKFLMTNVLKLVTRSNAAWPADELLPAFFARFPVGEQAFGHLFGELLRRKRALDFADPVPDLTTKVEQFVLTLERQFGRAFHDTAGKHVAVRHAPTRLNGGVGDGVIFQGRSDADAEVMPDESLAALADAVRAAQPTQAFASPLKRATQTLDRLRGAVRLPPTATDLRLHEQHYGDFEGLTVAAAKRKFPQVFQAWAAGDDPRLPGRGECVADVAARAAAFANDRWTADANSVTCTHNVVLRCLVGYTLGVPPADWHRLRIPHLAAFTFTRTREFGLFVDVPADAEREVFGWWADAAVRPAARAA